MNRRAFLVSSSAAFVAVTGSAQTGASGRLDGNWWKDSNANLKFGYVIGYAEGSTKADDTWAYGECKSKVSGQYTTSIQQLNNYSGIAFGQLVEGLEEFYKDFRNTRILAKDAMMIVKWQIRGLSQKRIDDLLHTLRQTALNPDY